MRKTAAQILAVSGACLSFAAVANAETPLPPPPAGTPSEQVQPSDPTSDQSDQGSCPDKPGDQTSESGQTGHENKPTATGGDFKPGFLNRVWRFKGEVDGYDDGVLSMTLDKILNLPGKFRDQDDDMVDEDMRVLVAPGTRVLFKNKPASRADLSDAEVVRIQGKLLKPDKWEEEDDQPIPTVRAKKIFILE